MMVRNKSNDDSSKAAKTSKAKKKVKGSEERSRPGVEKSRAQSKTPKVVKKRLEIPEGDCYFNEEGDCGDKKAEKDTGNAKNTKDDSQPTKKRGKKNLKVVKVVELKPRSAEEMNKKPSYYDNSWLGIEDDTGSVCSGILEEDFCLLCGESTLGPDSWQSVLLCDGCDGEHHIKCVGLQALPEGGYECRRCEQEREMEASLCFSLPLGPFQLKKKKTSSEKKEPLVYTPAKPLHKAWEECRRKGLMVVSEVFPYSLMKQLTHERVEHVTKSGRKTEVWEGGLREFARRLSSDKLTDLIDRDGRYELALPDWLVKILELERYLSPILSLLSSVMRSKPLLRTHNIVFVPVHSPAQQWHYDDNETVKGEKGERYFTLLIHLNPLDKHCGGTEVWHEKMNQGDLVRARPGDALVFPGNLLHRGLGNEGNSHRFFYYAAFSCTKDLNAGQA